MSKHISVQIYNLVCLRINTFSFCPCELFHHFVLIDAPSSLYLWTVVKETTAQGMPQHFLRTTRTSVNQYKTKIIWFHIPTSQGTSGRHLSPVTLIRVIIMYMLQHYARVNNHFREKLN